MDCKRYYDAIGVSKTSPGEKFRFGQTMPHLLQEGTILDVGCGCGYWLEHLSQNSGLEITALDISPVRLKAAKKNINGNGKDISLLIGDIRSLPYDDNQFDQVTALEVLEHIPEWKKGLDELARVASKRVVVTVPYDEGLRYEPCPNCSSTSYLNGHLNQFNESVFRSAGVNGNAKFKALPSPLGVRHYYNKFMKKISGSPKDEITYSSTIICPDCYHEFPFLRKPFINRAVTRAIRVIRNSPDYLLMQIDK